MFCLSHNPFEAGCLQAMLNVFILKTLHTSLKILEVNSAALSLTNNSGHPCLHRMCFMKASATSSAVLVLRATNSMYRVNESLKNKIYWCPVRESFFNGPKMSICSLENGRTGM